MDLINVYDKLNNTCHSYIEAQLDTSLINTIDNNRSSYTQCSYLKAQLVCTIRCIIRRPFTKDYKRFVAKNDIADFPISLADVNAIDDTLGKDWGSLWVNTVKSKPHQVQSTYINVP